MRLKRFTRSSVINQSGFAANGACWWIEALLASYYTFCVLFLLRFRRRCISRCLCAGILLGVCILLPSLFLSYLKAGTPLYSLCWMGAVYWSEVKYASTSGYLHVVQLMPRCFICGMSVFSINGVLRWSFYYVS